VKSLIFVALCCACAVPAKAQTTILHTFGLTDTDGQKPAAGLTLSGSTLYGTASLSGQSDGTIFSISTSGSGYTVVHNFTGGANDGNNPFSPALLDGSKLIGTTTSGGSHNQGTLYSLNTDGSGFTLLHSFSGGANDGGDPEAGVTVGGGKLFGTTVLGNNQPVNNAGTIYSINPDGSDFTLLHNFVGGATDGSNPVTALTLSASTLFGTTFIGGNSDLGTIFSLNTDGSGFKLLHAFNGALSDGGKPDTALALIGSKLYGMTQSGGANNLGTLFSMNTNGTGFTLLHSFGAAIDGRTPAGDLTLVGTTLYGTTSGGGTKGAGTIFSIHTDGTGYNLIYSLQPSTDGVQPRGGLVFSNQTLFGTTFQGAAPNAGTVYSLQVPEPSSLILAALGAVALFAHSRRR
jgi:uncharacterized repeat protein (TIGR03803 family)